MKVAILGFDLAWILISNYVVLVLGNEGGVPARP